MTRIPEGVGWTALLTAYGRAQEPSRATGRLFTDPLAARFVAAVTEAGDPDGGTLPRLGPCPTRTARSQTAAGSRSGSICVTTGPRRCAR